MSPELKFCGLTRREDAQLAVRLGARYLGVIFAGGPRALSPQRARDTFAGAWPGVSRVGVFGRSDADEVASAA
ncbi:MAG TPA: hypothetical protein VNA89_00465, partial [Gemmatimonadaceae bacterium]|nr:hypothetical protein [Gemmatimonadaceae bacterium]